MTHSNDPMISFALCHYRPTSIPMLDEFVNDMRIITYIKKSIQRDDIPVRVTLNHFITLFNCFGGDIVKILFSRIDKKYWGIVAAFLIYLHYMPNRLDVLGIDMTGIEVDASILEELKKL